jgi:Restriction endonuclease/Bacterial regulatory helix-turn-helix protein, lysR family
MQMQQVHYFMALCEELNFTCAARRCGVSQPSLSNAISALERELGGALFHRKPSIALTGLGRMVRPYLDEIARNADHAREVARTFQLFEWEFGRNGVEVKVTRASRDRGVDAIMFDPDPLRGGKFVLQAKRHTRPVDVAAVRDLYGTVVNEGANRGILVTTSSYGPDAYEFAKDKPLSLVDGPNLLAMLQKHGRRYRIDLAEARRLGAIAE